MVTDVTSTAEFGFDISESRLRALPIRPGTVSRGHLLERLHTESAPVIAVVAPAGFGKSTLLRQWVASHSEWIAWLSVDGTDNEPEVLAASPRLGERHKRYRPRKAARVGNPSLSVAKFRPGLPVFSGGAKRRVVPNAGGDVSHT